MYKEAAESLKQVIKIEPDNADAHYNMSLLFLKLRDKDSAFREYQILKEISPAIANKLSIQFH
jgi:Tfp pilus assembly protein PilF